MNGKNILKPLNNIDYLQELLDDGFTVKGPRNDPERDFNSLKAFLSKGKEFAPEDWLAYSGYKFIEPSSFTKDRRIAYKIIDDFPDERFRSNYSLIKANSQIPLYLKVELPKMQ